MKRISRLTSLIPAALFLSLVFSACLQQYDPRDSEVPSNPPPGNGGDSLDSLKGTVWVWDSTWGRRMFTFHPSEMTVSYLGQDGDDYTEPYTYDSNTKTGKIEYYGEAGFEISADNRIMHFFEWKSYGHGCDFTRLEQELPYNP
jgi:hypothetical protein